MKQIIFLSLLVLATHAQAITRAVNCYDAETKEVGLQILLRGGMATLNMCVNAPCNEDNMSYAQTLVLANDLNSDETLHYIYSSGKTMPVTKTMDILFKGHDGDPVQVLIDGDLVKLNCR